jgi:hypothetical protein
VGQSGTYVAWLSTSTVDAIDRLAGSRGWVRLDGAPVFDSIDTALTSWKMFNPIQIDETGALHATGPVRTCTSPTGRRATSDTCCTDWTVANTDSPAGGDVLGGMPYFTAYAGTGVLCAGQAPLYCFEVGGVYTVAPAPVTGSVDRIAFISNPRTAAGLAGLDAICQADAMAAMLPGTYRAAAATSTTSIASRFSIDARAIRRVDGTIVAPDAAAFFAGADLTSFINQKADGTYVHGSLIPPGAEAWTGASNPTAVPPMTNTCKDWSDLTNASGGYTTDTGYARAPQFWGGIQSSCDQPIGALCIEE